jgi:hypothetical protein
MASVRKVIADLLNHCQSLEDAVFVRTGDGKIAPVKFVSGCNYLIIDDLKDDTSKKNCMRNMDDYDAM